MGLAGREAEAPAHHGQSSVGPINPNHHQSIL